MNTLQVFYDQGGGVDRLPLGRLGYKDGLAYLEFSNTFLENGINISPISLKLDNSLQVAPRTPFNGLHGVFADSLPDGWGLLLMDRRFRQKHISPEQITPLERLAYMGNRTMGALSYQPDLGDKNDNSLQENISLNGLALESLEVYQGSKKEVSKQLQINGGSPAGVRPKATIGLRGNKAISGDNNLPDGYQQWLVKFPTGNSDLERAEGAIEYVYSIMTKNAGIDFPETQLIEAEQCAGFFASKRFDRGEENQRIHLHSLAGLINADFRVPDSDYEILMKATSHVTQSHPDLCEVLRRMIFNILSGNRDDHTKNFSFLMDADGVWSFSPAYDITYNHGINGHHSMSVMGYGKDIPLAAITRVANLIPLAEKEVNLIIEKVIDSLSQWRTLAQTYDVPKNIIDEIDRYMNTQIQNLGLGKQGRN